jgi:hypothetical protein
MQPSSLQPTVLSSSLTISSASLHSSAYDQPLSSGEAQLLPQPFPSALPTVHVAQRLFWLVPMHSWFDAWVHLLALPYSPWVDDPVLQVGNLVPQELQLPVQYGWLPV